MSQRLITVTGKLVQVSVMVKRKGGYPSQSHTLLNCL